MFKLIKDKVQEQFANISSHDLFEVKLEKNQLFTAYLEALPEEERQEHNCNCCKQFLNTYGGIVALTDTGYITLWDFEVAAPYNNVPTTLNNIVMDAVIDNKFLPITTKLGTDFNHQLKSGNTIKWEHFYLALPKGKKTFKIADIGTIRGTHQATHDVYKRGLEEITVDSIETVLDLISNNALYRGKEHLKKLKAFLDDKKKYSTLSDKEKDIFAWKNSTLEGRIRNTAIGTLLVDLSLNVEAEKAVKSYETMVAPANYKRPTALITKGMLDKAQKTIEELGLTSALERRFATVDDIPVTDVLYVNRDIKKTDIFGELSNDLVINPNSFKTIEEISLDSFISNVVPKSESLEVLVENRLEGNFMSVIAPVHENVSNLLNTKNDLSWVYKDNLADSVKVKVKNAGGSVDGELRISLEWFNFDDLDLHVIEPNGNKIYYADRCNKNRNGKLDVDMNAGTSTTREAVENIIFKEKAKMQQGVYRIVVNNFRRVESIDVGFNIELEHNGEIVTFNSDKIVGKNVTVAEFEYSKNSGISNINSRFIAESVLKSKQVFGIDTNKFHKVSMIMNSPNYIGEYNSGNKHTFFILDKAINPDTPRGFFNELLRPNLQEHRKVFEVLGNKLKVPASDKQLSGIGFSSTIPNDFVVKVKGEVNKTFRVKI